MSSLEHRDGGELQRMLAVKRGMSIGVIVHLRSASCQTKGHIDGMHFLDGHHSEVTYAPTFHK